MYFEIVKKIKKIIFSRKLTTSLLLAQLMLTTGCATTHTCPLDPTTGTCSSVDQTYNQAVRNGGGKNSVFPTASEYDPYYGDEHGGHGDGNGGDKNHANADVLAMSAPEVHPLNRKPVYSPAKVHRAWIAPWRSGERLEDQILHGGEYIYFVTTGFFNYGSLKEPGIAAGIIGPLDPNDFGLDIMEVKKRQQRQRENAPIKPEKLLFGR